MGDGGVTVASSQLVWERFQVSEALCVGNSGAFLANSFKQESSMKGSEKGEELARRVELGPNRSCKLNQRLKESELEKGELARERPLEKDNFAPDKANKWAAEKGALSLEKLRNGEVELGEFIPDRRQKGECIPDKLDKLQLEKGEFTVDIRNRSVEQSDSGSGRGWKGELEKGELTSEKWRKSDQSPEKGYRKKDSGRYEEQKKRDSSAGAVCVHERDSKKSMRVAEEELEQHKVELCNGKSRDMEHHSESWSKRHYKESESSGSRKYHPESNGHSRSKSQRKSEESTRSIYTEKLHGNASSSSSRIPSSSRHSSRVHDSSLSSRSGHHRQGRSPAPIEKSPHRRQGRSPVHIEKSPHEKARQVEHRDRTPLRCRSPRDKSSHHHHKERTPIHSDRSPHERARHHSNRDYNRAPGSERSPRDRRRAVGSRELSKKEGCDKPPNSRHEELVERRASCGKDVCKNNTIRVLNEGGYTSDRSANDSSIKRKELVDADMEPLDLPPPPPFPPPPPPPAMPPPLPPQPEVDGFPEILSSMEEDMDICDTPPHTNPTADTEAGKWFYLNHFGIEQGPSKLADLKQLVHDGILLSDHLIKHCDSDRWVTVENASSPLVLSNLPSVVSDTETQLVSPPEAPGNLLVDSGEFSAEIIDPMPRLNLQLDGNFISSETTEDHHIHERVESLLNGFKVIDGNELETIGDALNAKFVYVEWENWSQSEGFTRFQLHSYEVFAHHSDGGIGRTNERLLREAVEIRTGSVFEQQSILNGGSDDYFAGRWSCKGGDWKRNDEGGSKKKLVLNLGYPLCEIPKCGLEDPRWHRRDDLYCPSSTKKLDLPPWAFSLSEDNNDGTIEIKNMSNRSGPVKNIIPRGVKGTILPVVRINARVMKDHGSFEPHMSVRDCERQTSRSTWSHSTTSDRSSCHDMPSRSRTHEFDSQSLFKCRTVLNIPRDHVCSVHELSLDLGKWYYLDGAGHEHGPFSFVELRDLISNGNILENTSVFRKFDNTWVPISNTLLASDALDSGEEKLAANEDIKSALEHNHSSHSGIQSTVNSFHRSHPQFIGYMRGKLHELVMKSYKNREFAAAINEVLDPWISAKQPKKEMEKHFPFNSSITRSSAILNQGHLADKLWKSEDRPGKRLRLMVDESDECSETEDLFVRTNDSSFEELLGEAVFADENGKNTEKDNESWGLLNGPILSRVFHFLRSDLKALASSAATCKRWNAAVQFYKHICRHVDVSSIGASCSDTMFRCIMNAYDKKNLTFVILTGCSNISAGLLEEVLQLFPSISSVFIEGCNQFHELRTKFSNINWMKNNRLPKNHEDSYSKIRSLKQIGDKKNSVSKEFRGFGSYLDDSGDSGVFGSFDSTMVDMKEHSGNVFRHGFYKRAKLPDVRKPSSVLSRDAQMRHWMRRKTETGYRKLEEYVKFSLRNIMKGNSFDFFFPKVAEIEDRMRRGYYVRHGLGSLKDDISRMCRDALKAKNRGDSKETKHIIMLLIQLARNLERNPRLNNERDEALKTFKDASEAGLYSITKYKKKKNVVKSEKKSILKSNSLVSVNGGIDSGAFDREIKRSLSKLKKKNMNSDSETSDDHDNDFSEDEDESTASDTESDLDMHPSVGTGGVKGNGYFTMDDTFDTITDDREWGARMTKASLVPPVTRKYEVIDKYLVIADEKEVRRKMRVALPDDYSEKLLAQKSGIEESDMEIPEVKEYKPRKLLGVEVLEQEVYGIDPHTYNLLLDSMPDEPEWQLVDKHTFIEEVLLRSLNKKVRHLTGSGNTPMIYPLKPVIEEMQTAAEEVGDKRVLKLCHAILKAIHSRPDDNYVAYRKGLGVVCNKEEGFSEDDFVVEFLGEVYPSWKWFEKQDGIRSLQKNSQEPAPEFYNIYLERPKGDRDGYDLVVVDAMHKANYASRICHSCRPNCEAKVTAVDGQYQIGIYSLRPIVYGEEITFDYNSVTESKEEYEASVCLCGNHVCKGSYLNLTGEGAFQKVLMSCHGILDRHKLILEACEADSLSQEDYIELGRAGVGTCLLEGLPDWLVSYSAHLLRFINFERTKLPHEILKHNVEEKKKFFSEICLEVEKSDAEVQAEGVYNARLQNLALSLDKVRYVLRCVFGDPKKAPPPVRKLGPEALVSILWKGEGSLVEDLLASMAIHMEPEILNDLKFKIQSHDPSGFDNVQKELRKSLLWLRDELRNLPCTAKCRHDAAADLIHMYAYTKCFFKIREYKSVTSPPVYISPLDLGPKYASRMGSGFQEYCKTYGENYCLGQLIYWHSQNNADPDSRLGRARRGCLSLPDISSFYGKSHKPVHERVYDSRTVRFMLSRMEKQPERSWPKDRIWVFKSNPGYFGSPMLDAVLNNCPMDKEMVQWLKSRPSVYQGT